MRVAPISRAIFWDAELRLANTVGALLLSLEAYMYICFPTFFLRPHTKRSKSAFLFTLGSLNAAGNFQANTVGR